jgi:hypothetical protein
MPSKTQGSHCKIHRGSQKMVSFNTSFHAWLFEPHESLAVVCSIFYWAALACFTNVLGPAASSTRNFRYS